MQESNPYTIILKKLDSYYSLARENLEKPSFYKYLYNYLEVIAQDKTLTMIANVLWITKYMADHSADKKLAEIVASPSGSKNSELMWHTFTNMLKDENKDTRFYYSWIILGSVFYAQYNVKHDEIVVPQSDVSKLEQFVGRGVTVEEIGAANLRLKNAFKSLDFGDMPFNHNTFIDALNIFHTEFRSLINEEDLAKVNDPDKQQSSVTPKIAPPTNIKLEPNSYDAANGTLTIGSYSIQILNQPNRKGKLKETKEARLMRLVFHDVNSMQAGVPMRKIVSVTAPNFTAAHRKKVKNYITEINKKIPDELGINHLLINSQLAVMIDSRYL